MGIQSLSKTYQDIGRNRDRDRDDGPSGGGGGFDTSAADKAGTSEGSGQFSSKSDKGRQGY